MSESERDYQLLFHIVKYCEKLKAVKNDVGGEYQNFIDKNNYQKLDVSAFCIGQIGELVRYLSDDFKSSHTEIFWKQIVDTRNILVHRYGTRDNKIIWDIIDKDIPELNKYCRNILMKRNSNTEKDLYEELKNETNIEL